MSEPTTEQEEATAARTAGWFGLSVLTWSIVISAMLHGSVLVPSFLDVLRPSGEADVELEWMKSFDSLQGLGHGSDGRWAEIDQASFRTKNEKPEPKPEPQPEPKQPEPEPKPEPKQPEPEPEPEAEPEPKKPKPEEPTEKRELRQPQKPKQPTTPREVYSRGELPGLDRAGPNGLPAMEDYGPGNAIFTALIRLDRVRGTEFETPTRKLLEAVPDYRIVLQNTGVDPVQDLDSMFMASADPVYIQETFLAVRHRLSQSELRSALDRRFDQKIPWQTRNGLPVRDLVPAGSRYRDPRKVVVAENGLALIAQPEWMPQLTGALSVESSLVEGVDVESLDRPPTMLDGLAHIERAAEDQDTVVLVSAMGARITIPGIGRLSFEGAKMQVSNINRPRLTVDIAFSKPSEAKRFAEGCPGLKKRLMGEVPWIARSITRMVVQRLTCEASEHYVAVEGTYTREEAQRLLNIALPFVPRPAALAQLPPGPPPPLPSDEGAPTVDAGSEAAVGAPDAGSKGGSKGPDKSRTAEPSGTNTPPRVQPSEGDQQNGRDGDEPTDHDVR